MSLAEWARHAVIAEQGFSEVVAHELGHTFQLSQCTCSTGGAGETIFLAGCRDEYNHSATDGRPYLGSGYDVLGQVYPTGSGGSDGVNRSMLEVPKLFMVEASKLYLPVLRQ